MKALPIITTGVGLFVFNWGLNGLTNEGAPEIRNIMGKVFMLLTLSGLLVTSVGVSNIVVDFKAADKKPS